MLQNSLPQLNINYDDYILQIHGAPPPHFHRNVREFLNRVLQQRWIGRAAKGDHHLLPWPNHPDGRTAVCHHQTTFERRIGSLTSTAVLHNGTIF